MTTKICLRCKHGLGDALQFGIVIKHLRQKYPDSYITLETKDGREAVFRHLVDELRPMVYPWNMWEGDINKYAAFGHAKKDQCDYPCTKVGHCLLTEFKDITPDPSLFTYSVSVSPEACAYVSNWYDDLPRPLVAIHSEGHSHPTQKNIPRPLVATLCERLLDAGVTPLLLDWGDNKNGKIEGVIQPKDVPQDSDHLAALIEGADFFLGVDSGPGHLVSALTTPAYIVWLDMFPGSNYDLSDNPNVIHWITQESIDEALGDMSLNYFYENYRYYFYDDYGAYPSSLDALAGAIPDIANDIIKTVG